MFYIFLISKNKQTSEKNKNTKKEKETKEEQRMSPENRLKKLICSRSGKPNLLTKDKQSTKTYFKINTY